LGDEGGYVLKLIDPSLPVPEKGSPIDQNIEGQETEEKNGTG
jgi:hypothetical protein